MAIWRLQFLQRRSLLFYLFSRKPDHLFEDLDLLALQLELLSPVVVRCWLRQGKRLTESQGGASQNATDAHGMRKDPKGSASSPAASSARPGAWEKTMSPETRSSARARETERSQRIRTACGCDEPRKTGELKGGLWESGFQRPFENDCALREDRLFTLCGKRCQLQPAE